MKFWPSAVACLIAIAAGATAQNAPPPIEAFGMLPAISDPALSPDGKHLALIQAYEGRPVATIREVDALGNAPAVIGFEDGFIVGVNWANDRRLLITLNMNRRATYGGGLYQENVRPWFRTVAVDPDGKNQAILFANQKSARDVNYSASRIADFALDDPENIYMPLWAQHGTVVNLDYRSSIYKINVDSGDAEPYVRGGLNTRGWIMDGAGHVVARVDQTNEPLLDHILVYGNGDWREIAQTDASNGKGFDVFGLSLDGKSLVVGVDAGSEETAGLALLSLADGKRSAFYSHPVYDVSGILTDQWTGRIIGTAITGHLQRDTYIEPKYQDVQTRLNELFPGMSAHAVNWDRAFDRIVVSVQGPMSASAFYLYDRNVKRFQLLGRTYPQLKPTQLGDVRVYDYKARDGLNIPAYLTVPPGRELKNLPVVILPHGGPMARDTMEFDWERQFLATRGYAVLQPNFRGSSGYGTKFLKAGYGQWGLKMQDDVTDGVKKLIADGIADPKRICIVGGSYGGYAALAGAALTPDLYACAAAWAPVTNLRGFLATRSQDYGQDSAMISSWSHFIGDRWDDSKKLDAASPEQNADKIKVPVLLMHGQDDSTVRVDQSEDMDSALRHAGKKVTFIRIPKESHYMQSQETRVRWLTELEKFLKENIGS